MKQEKLNSNEESVISALRIRPLTSEEILVKANQVPHILKLYSILDDLRCKGMIKSYSKGDLKYHYLPKN